MGHGMPACTYYLVKHLPYCQKSDAHPSLMMGEPDLATATYAELRAQVSASGKKSTELKVGEEGEDW